MSIIYVLGLGLQILALVHAMRSGRTQNWMYVILFLPGIGALIYFAMILLPWTRWQWESQEHWHKLSRRMINVNQEIAKWEEEVKYNNTVAARLNLGDAYALAQRWPEAITQYASCLQGIYAQDVEIVKKLAGAYLQNHQWPEAQKQWETVENLRGGRLKPDELMYYGQTLKNLGKTEQAFGYFKSAAGQYPGLEGNYRYCAMLKEAGQADELALAVRDAERKYKDFPSRYKGEEKMWMEKIRKM